MNAASGTAAPALRARQRWVTALAGGVLLLAGGCSGAETATSGPSAAEAADGQSLTLALPTAGPLPNVGFIPVAVNKGFFSGGGVDLKIQYLQGAAAISAVQAGQADVVLTSPDPLLAANSKGGDLKAIYQIADQSVFSYGFLPDSKVTDIGQLSNAKIGVVATANIPASLNYINYDLIQAGHPPIQASNLLAIGEGAGAVTAVQTKQVDALFLTDSGLQTVKSAGINADVRPLSSLATGFPGLALMAKSSTIQAKSALLKNFLAAFARATTDCIDHAAQCMSAFTQQFPNAAPDRASADAQWAVRSKLYQPAAGRPLGKNDAKAWELAVTIQNKVGPAPVDLAPSSLYTNDLLGNIPSPSAS